MSKQQRDQYQEFFLVSEPIDSKTDAHTINLDVFSTRLSYIAASVAGGKMSVEDADLRVKEAEEARSIAARSSEQFQKKGYQVASEIMQGEATESILNAINNHNADIVALGASGLSGVESFLMGSVSERIARYATCSALIVRPPKK